MLKLPKTKYLLILIFTIFIMIQFAFNHETTSSFTTHSSSSRSSVTTRHKNSIYLDNELTTRLIFSNHLNDNIKHVQQQPNHVNLPNKLKFNRKRCRYSDHDIEILNKKNFNKLIHNSADSINNQNHVSFNYVKQPKVRDQYQYSGRQHPGHSLDSYFEKEVLYVNIGETINLTCNINAKEIDWHFKDKNFTTTILSYGLQLQVAQPNMFNIDEISSSSSQFPNYYNSPNSNNNNNYDYESEQSIRLRQMSPLVKYRVSSDKHYTHMLTLYVQGAQDEGAYQCIDSKSESPIKKSIYIYLKNNSRALTSGYNGMKNRLSSFICYFLFSVSLSFFIYYEYEFKF